MRRSLTIGLLSGCLLLNVSANARPLSDKDNSDIEGMLYCRRIPDELLIWSQDKIRHLMEEGKFIQWKDRVGRTRKTLEFGFSFKEMEENRKIVKYDIPPFLREIRRQIVELFQDHL